MSGLNDGLTELETALAATGIKVVTDPGQFTAPCVVVEAPVVTRVTQGRAYTMNVPVALVSPQPGNRATLDWLLDALPDVLAACKSSQANPGVYSPNGTQNYPAYRTEVTITIEEA